MPVFKVWDVRRTRCDVKSNASVSHTYLQFIYKNVHFYDGPVEKITNAHCLIVYRKEIYIFLSSHIINDIKVLFFPNLKLVYLTKLLSEYSFNYVCVVAQKGGHTETALRYIYRARVIFM